jgi:hypothetical protein
MGRRWLALAAAALLGAPAAPCCQEARDGLALPDRTTDRLDLFTLLVPGERAPRLLAGELRLSGIDLQEVQRTLEAYNRRSELAQFSRGSLVVAPYVLQRSLDMEREQLLQVWLSARTARLVLLLTWR